MQKPDWTFRRQGRREVNQGQVLAEFFSAQRHAAESLVREAGQNTLDAGEPKKLRRLVFTLGTADGAWEPYLKGVWPHLEAQPDLVDRLPAAGGPVPFLNVEDFYTSGLTGGLDEPPEGSDEKSHRLYWFFKNWGLTSKKGGDRGSWGIGKTVFPATSMTNIFFGYTVRADGSRLLLGQAQLKSHTVEEAGERVRYAPYGFFAVIDEREQDPIEEPVVDESRLRHFRETFALARDGEQGLSVTVVYPRSEGEITFERLAQAAVDHFFVPILMGELEVEVRDLREKRQATLRRADLEDVLETIGYSASDAADVRQRLDFCRWAITVPAEDHYSFPDPPPGAPKLLEDLIPHNERGELAAAYLRGDRIALRLPVPVRRKKQDVQDSHVRIYLQHDPNLKSAQDEYIREGITVSALTGRSGHRGLRAILMADDAPVAGLLRDSENIAHTEWRERNADRVTSGYDCGPSTVGYVKNSVRNIVSWLTSVDEEPDRLALADLFPTREAGPLTSGGTGRKDRKRVGEAATEGAKTTADPEGDSEEPDSPGEIPGNEPKVIRERLDDGFRVRSNPKYPGRVAELRVAAVIPTIRSKSFSKHSAADFSFENERGMVRLAGVEEVKRSHNRLTVRPTAAEWLVEVRGFDPRRPLRYDVRVATADAESEQAEASPAHELQEA